MNKQKTVEQHEDAYIHVPKSWYRPTLILVSMGILFVVLAQIINYDVVSLLSNILNQASIGIKQIPNWVFQLYEVGVGVLVASGIICYLTNRKKQYIKAFVFAVAFAVAFVSAIAIAFAVAAVFAVAVAIGAVAFAFVPIFDNEDD